MKRGALIALGLLTQACTTSLQTQNVGGQQEDIAEGVAYTLPATAIEGTISFVPTRCVYDGNKGTATFEYDILSADLQQRFIPDPKETRVIKHEELNAAFKRTNVKVLHYPNTGMLKSINADIDDRSAQVVASISSVAINLAKAGVFQVGVVSAAGKDACPASLKKTIDDFRALQGRIVAAKRQDDALRADNDAVDTAAAALEAARAAAAAAKDAEGQAKLKADVTQKEATLAKAKKKVAGRSLQVPTLQGNFDRLQTLVVAKATFAWVPVEQKDKPECSDEVFVPFKDYARRYMVEKKTTRRAMRFGISLSPQVRDSRRSSV